MDEYNFDHTSFFIQVWGILGECWTPSMAKELCFKAGTIGDTFICSIYGEHGFVTKVEVNIDLLNLICRGIHLNTQDYYDKIWVEYRYENCLYFVIIWYDW